MADTLQELYTELQIDDNTPPTVAAQKLELWMRQHVSSDIYFEDTELLKNYLENYFNFVATETTQASRLDELLVLGMDQYLRVLAPTTGALEQVPALLRKPIVYGYLNTLKWLVSKGYSPDDEKLAPLHCAVLTVLGKAGSIKTEAQARQMFDYLLANWPNTLTHRADGQSVLHALLQNDCSQIIRDHFDVLKEQRDDISSLGHTPLAAGILNHGFEAVKALIDIAPDTLSMAGRSGVYPIHVAAQYATTEIVQLILDTTPTMLDKTDLDGRTPLHYACQEQEFATVRLLLSRGANINATDSSLQRPLNFAKDAQLVSFLEKNGAKKGEGSQFRPSAR